MGALLELNHARLVALRPYMDGRSRLFAVIMVSNTGADNKPSQWWVGSSISDITGHLTGDDMRVTALAPDPAGSRPQHHQAGADDLELSLPAWAPAPPGAGAAR